MTTNQKIIVMTLWFFLALVLIILSTSPASAITVESHYKLGDGPGSVTVYLKEPITFDKEVYEPSDVIKAERVNVNAVGQFVVVFPVAKARYGRTLLVPWSMIKAIVEENTQTK